jgi:PIN domain nuclease of toxin-antitoxin system
LWWLANDPALPGDAEAVIRDPQDAIYVSAVNLWEIWLKQSLGKLRLPERFEERLAAEPFEHLPLAIPHTREIAQLPWLHRDPFDRMLVAQARTERMTLLTADAAVAAYGEGVRLVR